MKHGARGFTLIELMAAILVGGILFALAIPSYREMIRNNRVSGATNDLVAAFAIARSEALRQATPMSVCASDDGTSCKSGGGPTSWSPGWIVFRDPTTPGVVDSTDDIVQKWSSTSPDTVATGSLPYVRYAMSGMLATAAAQNIMVYGAACTGANARRVDISAVGSLSTTTQTCP